MRGGTPFVVTLKTLPDIAGGKRAYGLSGLSDAEALEAISTLRRINKPDAGPDWPLPLQKITAIAVAGFAGKGKTSFRFGALGNEMSNEAELLTELAQLLAVALYAAPNIAVGWQGREWLWPLLECRCVVNGVRMEVSSEDEASTWDVAPQFTGTVISSLGLRELAALWGESCIAATGGGSITELRQAAEVDAMLLMRMCMRVQAARGFDTQRQQAALKLWATKPQPAHLAAFVSHSCRQ